ncbi:MAG TPA: glycine--tRNA ligase subunit alpha [Terriglobales bacterium]|nr:glycine--tRNA ligase subunit alpha [Terriglobales bacterium]
MTFQDLVRNLQAYWAEQGCILQLPFDLEVGAGTMAPESFLRVLGPDPYKVAYPQPSRRPADGRYGENPNRLYKHLQFQVILKPSPEDVQDLYLRSLEAIGIDLGAHDIKFEEDNWEAPTLGAWGLGWQVMLDGLEITQFTYFQQCGGQDLNPVSCELTYGLERIAAFLQDVDSIYDIRWNTAVSYRDVRFLDELHHSLYNFEKADVARLWDTFNGNEQECRDLLVQFRQLPATARGRFPLLAAYELCLRCSHTFNLLDARGAISVTQRVDMIQRVRSLAVGIASAWMQQQHPIAEVTGA